MDPTRPTDTPNLRLSENSAPTQARNAPNGTAPLDEDALSLIIPDAPDNLLGLEMADSRTISADAPPVESVVCPFCAHVRTESTGSCPKCTMEDTPTTRRSTGERIGPWFVLQRKNPTAPGLRLSVLLTLARRGHVTAKSIVRGPTTGQFWRYASQVKGLSRVFGTCWHCGSSVSPDATNCPRCRSAQEIPDDPDQFLESHAQLPVMREVASPQIESEPVVRALPDRREPREERESPRDLAVRDSRAATGTRSVTLARGEDDVILSASELAAAFQLDLPKPGIVKRTSRGLWRLTKVAALLLILLSLGGAATLYFRPDWYAASREFAKPYMDKTQAWVARVAGRPARKPAALEDLSQLPPITPIQLAPTSDTSPANQDALATSPNKVIKEEGKQPAGPLPRVQSVWSSAVDENAPIDALAGQASVFLPTTRNASTPSQSIAELPDLVQSIIAKQEAERSGTKAVSKPEVLSVDTATPPQSLEDAIATAASLRTSALDAEARREWQAAVTIYEQISKLPEAAHPSDLKVKLAVARERARS